MVRISILLLTKNGRRDLERVLASLFSQRTTSEFEVVAVDSGSTDGTLGTLRRYPIRIEQISPEEFHHARTRNFAASLANGTILIYLSQDAIPASDNWLEAMVSNFDDERVGAVYGRQFPKPDSSLERHDVFNTIYGESKLIKDPAHRNGMGYHFYHFSDVNAAIRRSVWESERFPEDLKVFEDLGIAKQILDAGWKIVYEPLAAVFHSHSHTTLGLFKRYFDIGYTLRRLRIWDAPGTRQSILCDGWSMLKQKIHRKRREETQQLVLNSIRQDVAKSFGLFLGVNESRLPLAVKRHLSAFRVFE